MQKWLSKGALVKTIVAAGLQALYTRREHLSTIQTFELGGVAVLVVSVTTTMVQI